MILLRTRFGVGAALVLVALALLLPRLWQRTASVEAAAFEAERAERAVEYARARLWDDFLAVRQRLPSKATPPSPSLPEYARFLVALGLSAPGDVTTLYLLPADRERPDFDQVRVAFEPTETEVLLHVALMERGTVTPAGSLRIRPGSDGRLGCASRVAERPQLWSLWPVVPQPLLP